MAGENAHGPRIPAPAPGAKKAPARPVNPPGGQGRGRSYDPSANPGATDFYGRSRPLEYFG